VKERWKRIIIHGAIAILEAGQVGPGEAEVPEN